MLVVADSSPLIALINIAHIDILPRLFGKVIIPPEVTAELAQELLDVRLELFLRRKG